MRISTMYSAENEEVLFRENIYPTGNVEDWMLEIERVMKESMRQIIRDSLEDYKKVSNIIIIIKSQKRNLTSTNRLLDGSNKMGIVMARSNRNRRLPDLLDVPSKQGARREQLGRIPQEAARRTGRITRARKGQVNSNRPTNFIGVDRHRSARSRCRHQSASRESLQRQRLRVD